jgi:hypothetical protein
MTTNTDPHLISKIDSCPGTEELEAMLAAIDARDEELPEPAVQAVARRRVELQRRGR